jgi:hypothetical protein
MGFGIDRRARSRRPKGGLRALLGRAPDAREVGERLVRLSRRAFKGAVVDATPKRITVKLHPYAPPARIVVLPDGDLEIHAEVAAVGPAYQAEFLARLQPLLEELEYTLEGETGDDARTGITTWLAEELRGGATRIGMPADRFFKLDDPALIIQTALGPRDAAWRDAVIADPARGADAFAWWDRKPGREALSRALLAMWFDVPWREALDDAERDVMKGVDADLSAAIAADPALRVPWVEWNEILEWMGIDDAHAERVRSKIGEDPVPEMRIGYRRHTIEVEVSGGWTLDLGGAYVTHWEDDGTRWWATDGDRVVELSSFTVDGERDSQKLLDVAQELNPVIARLSEGDRRGRAEAYDEGKVHIVTGIVTSAPHVAILTCKGRLSDEDWALATWRSLRNAS